MWKILMFVGIVASIGYFLFLLFFNAKKEEKSTKTENDVKKNPESDSEIKS